MSPSSSNIRRRPRLVALALALALTLTTVAGGVCAPSAQAATSSSAALPKALDYVAACQRSDGGFAEKTGSGSSDAITAWTIIAIASAGQDPNEWRKSGASPVQYLGKQSSKWRTATDLARTALAASAAGKNPRDFGGVNLVARVRAEKQDHGDSGDSFGPYVNSHIWSLIALKAAGETVTQREVSWLLSQQNGDGGWGWAPGLASDSNDTAAAIQALVACGEGASSDGVKRGMAYLRGKQESGGAFSSTGGAADANSTAWGVQAIVSAGEDPGGSAWKRGSGTPMSALVAFQQPSGAIRYTASSATNPLLNTVQSIPAFASRPFPIGKSAARQALFGSAPQVALVAPAVGSTVSLGAPVTLQLSVSDGTGTGIDTGTLKVKVDGKSATARLSGSTATVGPLTLGAGSHTVTVTVADRAGNAAKSPSLTFAVAATASSTSTAVASSFMTTGAATATSTSASTVSSDTSSIAEASAAAATGEPAAVKTAGWSRSTILTAAAVGVACAAVTVALSLLGVWWFRRRKAR